VVLNTFVVRLLFPLAGVGMAFLAQTKGWGVFNLVSAPTWVAIPTAVLLLDLTIYGQHVMFHAVPLLWRLHRMRHADLEFDVTTGLRFHPGEIVVSMLIKLAAIFVLGVAAPVAVLIFEVVLNATSMFNHGNVRLPGAARSDAAPFRGDARHASCAPLGRSSRDRQQFRHQRVLVGPPVRNLP
jgi:sterol desaturase/sphingolipid hydroxylase (fatty acid hydroxylase superfamily)